MSIIKNCANYLVWIFISLLVGIGYMRIILGPSGYNNETGSLYVFDMFYKMALVRVGLIVGSFIALFYIILDIFYLKKKLKANSKPVITRILFLFVITIFVGVIHYILEKVIDVI